MVDGGQDVISSVAADSTAWRRWVHGSIMYGYSARSNPWEVCLYQVLNLLY